MVRHPPEFEPRDWSDPRSRPGAADELPRWLVAVGALAAAAIVVALLRYAVDLLGLVSVTVLVGFSIRTLTDWLTDSESVSGWALAAVVAGAAGTAAAGLWLFGSADMDRMEQVQQRLPPAITRAIDWAEERGWGGRMLLPDDRASRRTVRSASAIATPALSSAVQPKPRTPEDRRAADASGRAPAVDRTNATPTGDAGGAPAGDPAGERAAEGGPHATATRLTTAPARAIVGRSVRLTAVVVSRRGAPVPEGTVVFRRGSVIVGSARLEADGPRAVARLSTLDLPVGVHELVAEYVGGGSFVTSRSSAVRQVVVKD